MSTVLVLTSLVASAPPASAQVPLRERTPVVAGSFIFSSAGRGCTVGAVLKRYGPGSAVSPVAAATRYLVLAAHCAPHIDSEFSINNVPIGAVTWISPTDDLELVQVPPDVPSRGCFSYGCFVGGATPRPRAAGQVIMGPLHREAPVRMLPPASPAPGERFCTSGGVSSVNCNWVSEPNRPADWGSQRGVLARTLNAIAMTSGDSGGPVISQQGNFYGIHTRGGTGPYPNLQEYIPAEQIFEQIGSEYGIAPG
ncbi:hypothetical protein C5C18_13185 [Rathayibacter tritici]|uniref:Peptidase S1 domain-containing protein n=1 Tax=Rathayibacter tritici TaxID=33888 RepID=A0A160KU05_9MICO|nr:hypothetical protein [Rathayibacter tritici]AND17330.1 hypothetical protein A6122_2207 [Rathayibacter tritici]PPF27379.1 hypothetical protein C5C06_09855 [Rathayibacter tritici]PPF65178.1 hypothetical protein C5C21_11360 [Rathayibacter tritici]PPG04795.1 hypothetical protein C5C18_13185 [Rathayibacter tritici]PPI11340.1 hypothetical protein C5D07_14435 [Rathayibacter tritici]